MSNFATRFKDDVSSERAAGYRDALEDLNHYVEEFGNYTFDERLKGFRFWVLAVAYWDLNGGYPVGRSHAQACLEEWEARNV